MGQVSLTVPVGESVLGRVLNAAGKPIDELESISGAPFESVRQSVQAGEGSASPDQIIETGIKAIDLLTPVTVGGNLKILSQWGLGHLVLAVELMRNLVVTRGGHGVFVAVEERSGEWTDVVQALRTCGIADEVVSVVSQLKDSKETKRQAMLTGLTIAEHFRDTLGKDLFFSVDQRALADGVENYSACLRGTRGGSMFTLILNVLEDDAETQDDLSHSSLDGVIQLSPSLAKERLYPAVDPLKSVSRNLRDEILGAEHVQVAEEVQRCLRRRGELPKIIDSQGIDCLKEEDRQTVLRANRIQLFLTQPFFGAQLYTNIPGEYVKLEDTLRGFKGILEGQYDGLPEEAFRFVGAIDQAVEKAQRP